MYEILKILLLFTHVIRSSEGIMCFKCSPVRENRAHGVLPCAEFDWSEKYQVNCPKSTLCLKKTYSIPLGNGQEVQSTEMGCAPQSEQGQNYDTTKRKWYPEEKIIDSVYEEGCRLGDNTGRPGKPTEYCYCRFHFCNNSNSIRKISSSSIMLYTAALIISIWASFAT